MTAHVKVSGTYQPITKIHIRVGGFWQEARQMWVRAGGVWNKFHFIKIATRQLVTVGDDGGNLGFFAGTIGSIDVASFQDVSGATRVIIGLFHQYVGGSQGLYLYFDGSVPDSDSVFGSLEVVGFSPVTRAGATAYLDGGTFSRWYWNIDASTWFLSPKTFYLWA